MSRAELDSGMLVSASLLIANLIILSLWLWTSRKRAQVLVELRNNERFHRLTAVDLSRTGAARRFEIDWLLLTVHRYEVLPRAIELIQRAVGPELQFFACAIKESGQITTPASPDSTIAVEITAKGLKKLADIETRQLTVRGQEVVIVDRHASPLKSVWCFPIGASADREWLVVSHLPRFSGSKSGDQFFLSELCRLLGAPVSGAAEVVTDEPPAMIETEEVQLVRDMLQLRTLTDEDYSTPEDLLQQALSRLALLTDFTRASIYFPARNGGDGFERWSCGGESIAEYEAEDWDRAELRLLATCCDNEVPIWQQVSDSAGLKDLVGDRFQTILTTPLPGEMIPGGILLMVSRIRLSPRRATIDLARWAAEFLLTSFEKALARAQVEDRARRDALTRLANRHTFDTELQKQWQFCKALDAECSLLLIDVDHFKLINDTYGHSTGDEVLRQIAQRISRTVQDQRVTDRPLVARYGGEEFAAVIPECSLSGAVRIAESVRMTIESEPILIEQAQLKVTVSIGVAVMSTQSESVTQVVHAADVNLYSAKRAGRNRVISTPEPKPSEESNLIASDIFSA